VRGPRTRWRRLQMPRDLIASAFPDWRRAATGGAQVPRQSLGAGEQGGRGAGSTLVDMIKTGDVSLSSTPGSHPHRAFGTRSTSATRDAKRVTYKRGGPAARPPARLKHL